MVCGWTIEPDCGDVDPGELEKAVAVAVHVMWAATGRRYGACEVTVQPQRKTRGAALYQVYPVVATSGRGGWYPYILDGQWRNPGAGDLSCCSTTCEVRLQGPVSGIVIVNIDGEPIDASAYVVLDGDKLTRTDGGCWPACVNYSQQDPPQFEVTYLHGEVVPPDVLDATETLACELAKAASGQACGIPAGNVRRIQRQGVEWEAVEVDLSTTHVVTGIRSVDMVIRAHNPYGLTARPRVLSPDIPRVRQVTWP
jgi:hypothetical protein